MKKQLVFIFFIVLAGLLSIVGYFYLIDKKEEKRQINDTSFIDSEVDLDNGEEKVDWESLESKEIKLSGKSVSITKGGNYTLNGMIKDGSVVVNTGGDVKLILDGISISSSDGPAILIEAANNVIIELKDDTKNYVSDGKKYSNIDYNGCIHSKSDLIFQGNGSLEVNGNFKDGIVSRDDLKFISGNYSIKSEDDGIVGKDSIYVVDGNISVKCNSDGFKSSNVDDSTKGFINIDGGSIKIESGQDGMQAESKLIINDGDISIKTSDGSGKANDGQKKYNSYSCKGLKSRDNLVIKNGNISINASDDGIHTNNYVGIVNGSIEIKSGDDAIHADKEVIVDDGLINILQAYEGIEAENVTINGGDISFIVNDDGINISGNSQNIGGIPGRNHIPEDGGSLIVTGGKLDILSVGDGIDVNGNIIMTGGEIYIDGCNETNNAAIDYDKTFEISGGVFMALGDVVMAQTTSEGSIQNSVMFYLKKKHSGKISLVDSNKNKVFSYNPRKEYSNIVISSPLIKMNEEYNLLIDDKNIASLKVDKVNSVYGSFVRGEGVVLPEGE